MAKDHNPSKLLKSCDNLGTMTARKLTIYLIIICALVKTLDAKSDSSLTWDDCVRLAVKNNKNLLQAKSSLEQASANRLGLYGDFFPQITANSNYSISKTGASDRVAGKDGLGSSSKSLTGNIDIDQNIFAGLRDWHKSRKGNALLEMGQKDFNIAKSNLLKELKTAYANFLYSQKKVQLTESIAKRLKRNVDLVKLRFDRGRENKGSYLSNKANYTKSQFEYEQSIKEFAIAKKNILTTLGLPLDENINVKGGLGPFSSPPRKPDFSKLSLNSNVRQKALEDLRSAEHSKWIAFSEHLPHLDASYTFGKKGAGFYFERNYNVAQLNLTIPIFSGFKTSSEHRVTVEEEKKKDYTLQLTTAQNVVEVETKYNLYSESIQQLEISKNLLEAVEIKSEIARNKYASGLIDYQNWDDVERELITTQKLVLTSKRDALIAEADWEFTIGKELTTND